MAGSRFKGLKWLSCVILGVFWVVCLSVPVFASQKVEVESLKTSLFVTDVDVSTSIVALPTTALKGRKVIVITNNSSNTIYLGTDSVTVSNGLPLYKKQSIAMDATDNIVIYGIASTGTNDIRILELR